MRAWSISNRLKFRTWAYSAQNSSISSWDAGDVVVVGGSAGPQPTTIRNARRPDKAADLWDRPSDARSDRLIVSPTLPLSRHDIVTTHTRALSDNPECPIDLARSRALLKQGAGLTNHRSVRTFPFKSVDRPTE